MTDYKGVDVKIVHEREFAIYGLSCICHPEVGVRYVGLTTYTAQHRLYGHRTSARKGSKSPIYDWMRKHGPNNVVTRVLERTEDYESLAAAEIAWIAKMRAEGASILNVLDGGDNGLGPGFWTHERRDAVSRRRKGAKASPETRAKLSAVHKGRTRPPKSPETLERMSDAQKGRKATPEARANMAAAQLGRKFGTHTMESRALMSERRKGMLRGSENGRAKIGEMDVREIRALGAAGMQFKDIAPLYGISASTASRIVSRRLWAHLE